MESTAQAVQVEETVPVTLLTRHSSCTEDEFEAVVKKTYQRRNTISRQLRTLKVIGKRHDRSTYHLDHFIRIRVAISSMQIEFDLVVDKRNTIEYLGHLIEAEYTYRYVIPLMNDEGDSKADALICGAMYDSEKHLLRFVEKIVDVIDVDSEVHVINTFHAKTIHTGFDSLRKMMARPQSSRESQSLDDFLKKILRNRIALETFHDFCVETFAAEFVLFWVAVAAFDDAPEKEKVGFAQFIFKTFIEAGAPLVINIGTDILKEISVSKEKVASELFDEVQEEVYCIFVGHILEEFKKSSYMSALEEQQKDITKYRKNIIFTNVYEVFKPSSKEIAEISELISNVQRTTFDYGFRHKILQKTIQLFFPKSKFTEINGYYNDSSQLSIIQKQRQIGKGKKIAKFFGEHISFDALKNQLPTDQFTGNSLPENLKVPVKQGRKKAGLDRTGSSDTIDSLDSKEILSDKKLDLLMKKKKMDKLQAFFGDVPMDQDTESGLPNAAIEVEDGNKAAYVPPTFNELSSLEKAVLQKRQRKIQNVFGEKIDEHMAFKIATGCKQYSKEAEAVDKNLAALTNAIKLIRSRSSDYDISKPRTSKGIEVEILEKTISQNQRRASVITVASTTSTVPDFPDEKQIIRKKFTKLAAVLGDPLLNRTEIDAKNSGGAESKWADESSIDKKSKKSGRAR